MKKFILVQTTCPKISEAKKLAEILLQEKLAACVDFFPIESHYLWQTKIVKSDEILVNIKSQKNLYKKIEKTIKENHSYEIPQIISTQINQGFAPYLKWLEENTKSRK
jgi:periplasmic divalent cation tolerance protein